MTRLAGIAVAAALTGGPAGAGTMDGDAERLALGARIYADACASCHGAALEGQTDWELQKPDGTYPAPPHDATGHTWHHSDRLLFRYVKLGGQEVLKDLPGVKSNMPGFGDRLTDDEIRAVLAFIRARWPEHERAYQETVTANDN